MIAHIIKIHLRMILQLLLPFGLPPLFVSKRGRNSSGLGRMLRSAVPPNLPSQPEDHFSGSDKPLRCNGRPRLSVLGVSTFAEMQRGRRGSLAAAPLLLMALLYAPYFPMSRENSKKFVLPALFRGFHKKIDSYFSLLCVFERFCIFRISHFLHSNSWALIFFISAFTCSSLRLFSQIHPRDKVGMLNTNRNPATMPGVRGCSSEGAPGPENRIPIYPPERAHRRRTLRRALCIRWW